MPAGQQQPHRSPERSADSPWAERAQDVASTLGVDPATGLDTDEAARRTEQHGHNRLRTTEQIGAARVLLKQFESPVIWLLAGAALVSLVFARWLESIAIGVVILVNTAIGFVTELRAVRSMEALRTLSRTTATVRRDGRTTAIPAADLVPGDAVLVEAGDVVTADVRLTQASKLEANESALTGESSPVAKGTDAVDEDTPLAERACMLYKGTVVSRGSGEAVVVATGMATELGRIASLTERAEQSATPLEQRIEGLARRLIWITLGIAAGTILIGLVRGKEALLMAETGIALAVAAIPEGLPIVTTLALAWGMHRLARRNALIKRLSAVETLGATGVILTDKTGTLTENQMTVQRYALESGEVEVLGRGLDTHGSFRRDDHETDPHEDPTLRRALEVGVLCNNASLKHDDDDDDPHAVGDPMEIALLVAGRKAGLDRTSLLEHSPEHREEAFDPDTRAMATFHPSDGRYRVAVKGSPESVLAACTSVYRDEQRADLDNRARERWATHAEELAGSGLRLLALAEKECDDPETDPYEALTLIGLCAMHDPPRRQVRPALQRCREAGIRVVMATGDQAGTAGSIARRLGMVGDGDSRVLTGRDLEEHESDHDAESLRSTTVFARMDPEHKLRLLALHQDAGAVVAMTGDGINDAPALKKADIGIAMGHRGAQAARESSDMVLQDDNFETIVAAVGLGRTIFANIRRAVFFMLCTNVAEVIAVTVATVAGWTLPLRPLQILYLNVLTDVFPALALGVGPGTSAAMRRPPRDPAEPILTRRHWAGLATWATLIAGCVLGSMLLAERAAGLSREQAVTVSFLTLGLGKLWFTFNLRDPISGLVRNEITRNPWVWGAITLCLALLAASVYLPGLSAALETARPGADGWILVAAGSLAPLVLGQLWLLWRGLAGSESDTLDGKRPDST